jgi:hypothetical protein
LSAASATKASKVLIAAKPVDFRKGGDGLAALVREALGEACGFVDNASALPTSPTGQTTAKEADI